MKKELLLLFCTLTGLLVGFTGCDKDDDANECIVMVASEIRILNISPVPENPGYAYCAQIAFPEIKTGNFRWSAYTEAIEGFDSYEPGYEFTLLCTEIDDGMADSSLKYRCKKIISKVKKTSENMKEDEIENLNNGYEGYWKKFYRKN